MSKYGRKRSLVLFILSFDSETIHIRSNRVLFSCYRINDQHILCVYSHSEEEEGMEQFSTEKFDREMFGLIEQIDELVCRLHEL